RPPASDRPVRPLSKLRAAGRVQGCDRMDRTSTSSEVNVSPVSTGRRRPAWDTLEGNENEWRRRLTWPATSAVTLRGGRARHARGYQASAETGAATSLFPDHGRGRQQD